jgi:glutathione S-transferase
VAVAPDAQAYCDAVPAHPYVVEWVAGAEDQAREIGWRLALRFRKQS